MKIKSVLRYLSALSLLIMVIPAVASADEMECRYFYRQEGSNDPNQLCLVFQPSAPEVGQSVQVILNDFSRHVETIEAQVTRIDRPSSHGVPLPPSMTIEGGSSLYRVHLLYLFPGLFNGSVIHNLRTNTYQSPARTSGHSSPGSPCHHGRPCK